MKKILFVFAIPMALLSCSSGEENLKDDVVVNDDSEFKNDLVFAIPSPNEQFDLLQMIGGELVPNIVHDLSRLDDYATEASIAFNFGVYSADAAYLMKYEQGKRVFMDYVSGLDKLGQKLGISQIYGEELIKTIEEASDDPELLYDISGDNYLKVYDMMLENQKGAELAMILAGGWIETMHILFSTAGDFGNDIEIEDVISEQRYVLENLLGFMGVYSDNANVQELVTMLDAVIAAYNKMDCEEAEVEVKKADGNKMILSGGDSCLFTQESYNALSSAIKNIRTKYIA
jgi:hypothetical protein